MWITTAPFEIYLVCCFCRAKQTNNFYDPSPAVPVSLEFQCLAHKRKLKPVTYRRQTSFARRHSAILVLHATIKILKEIREIWICQIQDKLIHVC